MYQIIIYFIYSYLFYYFTNVFQTKY